MAVMERETRDSMFMMQDSRFEIQGASRLDESQMDTLSSNILGLGSAGKPQTPTSNPSLRFGMNSYVQDIDLHGFALPSSVAGDSKISMNLSKSSGSRQIATSFSSVVAKSTLDTV